MFTRIWNWIWKNATKIANGIAILTLILMTMFVVTAEKLISNNLSEIHGKEIGPSHFFVAFANCDGKLVTSYEGDIDGSTIIEVPSACYIGINDGGKVNAGEAWSITDNWVETCWEEICPRWSTMKSNRPDAIVINP